MADGNQETTNGKEPSIFDKLRKDWIASHGGTAAKAKAWRPNQSSADSFKEKIVKARKTIVEAEDALAASKKAAEEAEAEAIAFFGPNSIKLKDGTVLEPTCRGERLFYKESSGSPL